MKEEMVTEQTIKRLVDTFYDKIRREPELGPFFADIIGNSNNAWESHLEKMYTFWSSIMLKSGRYNGNPFRKHQELPAFNVTFFDRWLELFAETVHEIHPPHIAAQYIEKSMLIAQSLKQGLYGTPANLKFI